MQRQTWILILGLVLSSIVATVEQAYAIDSHDLVAQVDIDGNGSLDRVEVLVGLENNRLENSLNLAQMHADRSIPKALREDLEKRSKERLKNGRPGPLANLYAQFVEAHGTKEPWAIDEVSPREFGLKSIDQPAPSKRELALLPQIPKHDLKIRRSKQDLAKAVEDKYAQGAILSFAHNYNKRTDTWTARGIAQYTYSLVDNPNYDPLSVDKNAPRGPAAVVGPVIWNSLSFEASTSWDKVNVSPGKAGELDSLRFDVGGSRSATLTKDAFAGDLLKGFELKGSGFFVTDFEFDKKVFGAELEAYLRLNLPGCAHTAPLSSLMAVRWVPWLHAEAGRVEAPGSSANLRKYDGFGRIGGGAVLELWVLPINLQNRLSFQGKYLYYEGCGSGVEAAHLFSASLQYVLPLGSNFFQAQAAKGVDASPVVLREKDMQITFRMEYTDGELPVTQQRDHTFLFGIGVAL